LSLKSKLETYRTLLVQNLNNKGISDATTSMGLTTLANKIPNINTGETYTISTITPFTSTAFVDEMIPITVTVTDTKNKPADYVKCYLKVDNIVQEETINVKDGRVILNFTSDTVGEHTVQAFINDASVSSPITITVTNPNYYVNPAGSDSNNGTSSTTPFKTLTKAITTATDKSSIYVQAGYYAGTDNTVLSISKNLTIYSNGSALFDGGNVRQSGFTVATGYSVTLNGLKFINGSGNAGAVTVNENCSIINCNFTNNNKSTSTDNATGWGGAVYCIGSNNYIFNSDFYSNKAYNGGAIWNNSSNIVTDCTFSGNNASSSGGAIWNNSSNNTVTDCTFSGNNASNNGGAIWNNSSNIVTDCTFSNNASSSGGAISNGSSNIVTDCTFSNNTSSNGGAIRNDSSNIVTDCTFSNNASSSGGAILNDSSNNTVTDCTFSGNNASSSGGAIYIYDSNVNVKNCSFKNNTPTNLYVQGTSSGTVTNCYWGTDTPTTTDYGSLGGYTVSNNATSKTVYNIIKYTQASVSSGTSILLTIKCNDCNGNPLSDMILTLKDGTNILTTLTTDTNGLATYTLTVTASMSLTVTNTATDNYNSCTSETRTITLA